MVTPAQRKWGLRATTSMVWALAGASAVYWGLRMTAPAAAPAAAMPLAEPAAIDPEAVARVLGSLPQTVAAGVPQPALSSRFVLLGLLAGRSNGGAALISVDGNPAKPFRVGSEVDPGLVLQAVERRRAVLGARAGGDATLALEIAPYSTGTSGTSPSLANRQIPGFTPSAGPPPMQPLPVPGGRFDQAPAR